MDCIQIIIILIDRLGLDLWDLVPHTLDDGNNVYNFL